MEYIGKGGLGDELAMTALVREHHRDYPDEMIRIVDSGRWELWEHNPNINRGNADNGKRVRLEPLKCTAPGSLPRKYAVQLAERCGPVVTIQDDTPEVFLKPADYVATRGVPPDGIAVDPWAFSESRRWSYTRFVELCRRLLDAGYEVYEVGKRARQNVELATPLPCTRSFFGALALRETAALLTRCSLYIGNDSGLFHLAAAVGVPQVVTFGAWRGAERAYASTTVVEAPSPCARTCGRRCTRKAGFCMNEITVDDMFRAVMGRMKIL